MAAGQIPPHAWKPGSSPYADYLANLTPDEKAAHLAARATKKSMKQAMKAVVKHQQDIWISELNNVAARLIAKAVEEGDTQAFIAVWDRVVGKPESEVKFESETPLVWADDFDDGPADDEEQEQ